MGKTAKTVGFSYFSLAITADSCNYKSPANRGPNGDQTDDTQRSPHQNQGH